jgi:hypothetical protein
MPIDVNALENFMPLPEALAFRTEYRHFVSMLAKRSCFLPDASVERNRKVLDDNQNSSFCLIQWGILKCDLHVSELRLLRATLPGNSNKIYKTLTISKL